ncbi:MAG: hypothetical protein M3037_03395 [Gemmatimonadota bacterium]|nr:hypothetical protein [Gemmatimonadota bacterium]
MASPTPAFSDVALNALSKYVLDIFDQTVKAALLGEVVGIERVGASNSLIVKAPGSVRPAKRRGPLSGQRPQSPSSSR